MSAWNLALIESVVAELGTQIVGYTEEIAAQEQRALRPSVVSRSVTLGPVSASGGGGIDYDGLANCEGSGNNGWRTGYYGLETGTNDVGSWSLEAQQAKVREIYAAHGASAWGVNCQRFLGG